MTENSTYREHPVSDYRSVLDADTQLVDVREPHEVMTGSLPGAINIPVGQFPARLAELDTGRRVVLLCRSGGRSGNAARFLVANGFTDVINLAGGMLAYADPSTIPPLQRSTKKVQTP